MVNGSFCSNTHHFRDIEVFLEAGNDVMVIYPLGGAVYTDVDLWLMRSEERSGGKEGSLACRSRWATNY